MKDEKKVEMTAFTLLKENLVILLKKEKNKMTYLDLFPCQKFVEIDMCLQNSSVLMKLNFLLENCSV